MAAVPTYGTLVANQVATEALDTDYGNIVVINLSTTAADIIYFAVNPSFTVTVEGDGTFAVPPSTTKLIELSGSNKANVGGAGTNNPTVVKLKSVGTPKYGIEAW